MSGWAYERVCVDRLCVYVCICVYACVYIDMCVSTGHEGIDMKVHAYLCVCGIPGSQYEGLGPSTSHLAMNSMRAKKSSVQLGKG